MFGSVKVELLKHYIQTLEVVLHLPLDNTLA